MTAQVPDRAQYEGEWFDLIGLEGHLPRPQNFGMEPHSPHAACRRGYHARYEIHRLYGLFLYEMVVYLRYDEYRPIFGVLPEEYSGLYSYINMPVPLNGRLRLARGFLPERYVHAGFQPASAYETVLDLALRQGRVACADDRSDEVRALRRHAEEWRCDPLWRIADAFSLSMDLA